MRKQKDVLQLECVLNDLERLAYAKQLAEFISRRQRAEDGLKSFQSQVKGEISGHEAQINLLSEKLNTGREYRAVECEIIYDWDNKLKKWRRLDTKEIAKEDIIPERELQEELAVEKK
jgi:dTDP-4-dehydrorhamnose reductase